MRKFIIPLTLISVSIFFIFASSNFEITNHKYIGVKSCTCHKMASKGNQIDIWQKTKHASAFNVLKTEEANKYAKDKGLEKPAVETPECLTCHVTGYGQDTAEKYSQQEGITCEACHGPASDWKNLHSKKDKLADAIEAGFIMTRITEPVDKEKPEGMSKVEEHCRTCHNEKSPSFKEFKFIEMWKQIAHPLPKQEK